MKYHPIERNRGPYVFEAPRNPWPSRILMGACFLIISLTGSLLLAGFFGFLST